MAQTLAVDTILPTETLEAPSSLAKNQPYIYFLFFLSGFPALIYQIVWQRSLFSIYGVNIESVTMVVSAFMLGLGLGSLLGGILSTAKRIPLLAVFGLVELGVGVFGLTSLRLFHWVALFTVGVSPIRAGLISFAVLLIPTVLMGCTLPLLVAYFAQLTGNMGQSVAILYLANTLGSAGACFVAAKVTMPFLGQSGSVAAAAAMNLVVASGAMLVFFRSRRKGERDQSVVSPMIGDVEHRPAQLLWLPLAIALVGVAGFISLSYEIVWYRIYSFTSMGQAKSFPYLLGAYLAGIAGGAAVSERICREAGARDLPRFVRTISALIVLANLVGFLVVPMVAHAVQYVSYPWTLPLVAIAAGLLGAVFPLICHIAVRPDGRAGAGLSYLYLSNIIGSTSGSFLVGFVLMNFLSLERLSILLALAGIALGLVFLLATESRAGRRAYILASGGVLGLLIVFSAGPLFDLTYEHLMYHGEYRPNLRFRQIVETNSGVVTVSQDKAVYGGGIYDGRFNVDPMHDTNRIVRPFALSSFHAAPKDVLMIGLSSGSWAQVIANHPQVERFTIVEINPGYLPLIPLYPEVASLLKNPKVRIVIDDGRRWLSRNPRSKFDAIVSNSTYHWRANGTNLLSTEFLRLVRAHLNPGGIFFYNTTGSGEVQITGATVFPFGLRIDDFLVLSDNPIRVDRERWRSVLLAYEIDGKPVFDVTQSHDLATLNDMLAYANVVTDSRHDAIEYIETLRPRVQGQRIITDDNMGTEWQQ